MNKYLDKVELEPGVYWNSKKKVVEPSREKYNEAINSDQTQAKLISSAVVKAPIGAWGGAIGGATLGNKMRASVKGRAEDLAAERAAEAEFHKNNPPRVTRNLTFTRTASGLPHDEYPSNIRKAKYLKRGAIIGAIAGGVLGYPIHSFSPAENMESKNRYLDKMEKKHEKAIDKIEGWD